MTVALTSVAISEEDAVRLYRDNPKFRASAETFCPTCLKNGTYQWKGETVECNCFEQLQLAKHYMAAGIGDTYQRLSWDDYDGEPEAKALCDEYLENASLYVARGISIIFSGLYGTGKTMSTTLLLKDLLKLGYSVYSTTFSGMVESYTAGWNSMEDKEYFNRKVRGSQILLLDDLGKEFKTKNELAETTFDSVLRYRVQHNKPTFITTNMTRSELRTGYGSAIFSLLNESSIRYEFENEFDARRGVQGRKLKEIREGQTRPIF